MTLIDINSWARETLGSKDRSWTPLLYQGVLLKEDVNRETVILPRRFGKTTLLAVKALYKSVFCGENVCIICSSPSNLGDVRGVIRELISNKEDLISSFHERSISFKSVGKIILLYPSGIYWACGNQPDYVLVDNLDMLNQEQIDSLAGEIRKWSVGYREGKDVMARLKITVLATEPTSSVLKFAEEFGCSIIR